MAILVGYVNSADYKSDVAGKILEMSPKVDMAVVYSVSNHTGETVFSLRSRQDGPDVTLFAKALGGGGHPHASGCTTPYVCGWLPGETYEWHISNYCAKGSEGLKSRPMQENAAESDASWQGVNQYIPDIGDVIFSRSRGEEYDAILETFLFEKTECAMIFFGFWVHPSTGILIPAGEKIRDLAATSGKFAVDILWVVSLARRSTSEDKVKLGKYFPLQNVHGKLSTLEIARGIQPFHGRSEIAAKQPEKQ